MSTVLYRKYRPKSFDDLVGQDHIKTILKEIIESGNIPHAFLFSGPRGTGKTTTARLLARAINDIDDKDYEQAMRSTDIIEMDAASNRKVEDVDQFKEGIGFMPTTLKKKIYIIDEVHMLTNHAFNALLKTLEEPPEHVVFILATTEPHKLPITILSRVQRHDFKLGSKQDVVSKLQYITQEEGYSLDDGALELIYRISGGSYRDAESTLSKILQSSKKKKLKTEDIRTLVGIVSEDVFSEIVENINSGNTTDISERMDMLLSENTNWDLFLNEFVRFIHAKMISGSGDAKMLHIIFESLISLTKDISYFDQKKIVIEVALLSLARDLHTNLDHDGEIPQKVEKKRKSKKTSNNKTAEAKALPKKTTNTDDPKKVLVTSADKENKRLKAILITSDVLLSGNICRIRNEYTFNTKYLEKREISNFIKQILNENGYNVDTLEFLVGVTGEDSGFVSEENNSAKLIEKVQEKKEVSPKNKSEKKIERTQKDNSELVESMF